MKIYKGKYTSSSDQVATFKDGKIYKGKYTSSSDQVGTMGTDGKIYRGRLMFPQCLGKFRLINMFCFG